MTIKLMRYIDYWIGVPLCFILTIINSILKLISFKRKQETITPQRILIIKLSELGAIILAYPLLRCIKEEYPCAEISFLTFERNREVFKALEEIISDKNILTIRQESIRLFALDTLRVIRRIRKEGIDIIFDLEFFSRFSAILTYLGKAGKKIGFYRYTFEGLYRGNLLTHKIQYNPLIHISQTYLSLWQVVKEEKKSTPELEKNIEIKWDTLPKFISSSTIRERIRDRLKEFGINKEDRLFLVNPGEGILPLREWPLDSFISLCKKLLEDVNSYIIIVGTKIAFNKAKSLYNAIKSKRCINLVGETTLPELLELFNISNALIINDCGLGHLASLTSIKKFIIFGPESPEVFGPLGKNNYTIYSSLPCSPCLSVFNHRKSTCKDNKCLKRIKPEDVYDLIMKSL